jgi:uncharacterized membrane protein
MKEKTPLIIISCLIALVAIVNLARLLWNIPLCIGSFVLPGWTGAIAFLLFGLLAAWSFRALCLPKEIKETKDISDRGEEPAKDKEI